MAATDFIIQKAGSTRGDRVDQIDEVIAKGGDGKPALFLRASHFTFLGAQYTSSVSDEIVRCRKDEYDQFVEGLVKHLRQTYWLCKKEQAGSPSYALWSKWKATFEEGNSGDAEVDQQVINLVQNTMRNYNYEQWTEFYRPEGTMKFDDALRED